MYYTVVLLAAGSGQRFNKKFNKLFVKIHDKNLIDYSLDLFNNFSEINQIIIVTSPSNYDILKKTYSSDTVSVIIGGKYRQESVFNAIDYINNDNVLIHDAARPMIDKAYIEHIISIGSNLTAITIGSRVTDTIHVNQDDQIIGLINRDELVKVYTPQAFKLSLLKDVHLKSVKDSFIGTDDISLVFKYSHTRPKIYFSNNLNIKLTTSEDLKLLEVLLK